jgi:hypothetical protein
VNLQLVALKLSEFLVRTHLSCQMAQNMPVFLPKIIVDMYGKNYIISIPWHGFVGGIIGQEYSLRCPEQSRSYSCQHRGCV